MGKIADFPWGYLGTFGDNEIEIVSTRRDPPKVRLAVQADLVESNLGAVSFNLQQPDGSHQEYGYVMGRLTADKQEGAIYIALRPRGEQQSREVLYIDPNQAIFRVPVQTPGKITRFYTDGGKFAINWQDDTGHAVGVIYDTKNTADESQWVAVGRVRIDPI